MPIRGIFAVLLMVASFTGRAETPPAEEIAPEQLLARIEAQNAARLQLARGLAATGEPRKLYAASLLVPMRMDLASKGLKREPEADAWLAQAIASGSTQPLIAMEAVRRCIGKDACAIDAAVQTLQGDGAADAGSQLLLKRLAEHRKDAAQAAQAWQRATQATRYVDSLAQLVGLLDEATRDVAWPVSDAARAAEWEQRNGGSYADQERAITLFGIAATVWMPELKTAIDACPKDIGEPVRRQACERVFSLMADSTSNAVAQAGARWMFEASAGTPAQSRWEARRRLLAWISVRASGVLGSEQGTAPKVSPADYMRWIGDDGELPAMRRLLAVHGIAAEPPADWQPPSTPR